MARLGVAPIVLGHVANHRTTTRAGVTLAVYSHYAYDSEKRESLDRWSRALSAIVSGKPAFRMSRRSIAAGPMEKAVLDALAREGKNAR
jgi:hypothetical protein